MQVDTARDDGGGREKDYYIAHDGKKDDGIPFSIAVRFTTATDSVDDDYAASEWAKERILMLLIKHKQTEERTAAAAERTAVGKGDPKQQQQQQQRHHHNHQRRRRRRE